MSHSQQDTNNDLAVEPTQYEHVYPRAAPQIVPVGVSRFREEMDAEVVDPLTVGGFDPYVNHLRIRAIGDVRRGQIEQPQRVRDMMAMSPVRGLGKKEKNRTCAPISAGAWISSFFTLSRGKAIRQTTQAAPAQPVQPQAFVPSEPTDSVIQRPLPAAVRHLHRSNAVRRLTEQPREPKPAPCRLQRSNAVRRPTRQESLVSGGDHWILGHYPGGEADEYYLAELVVERPQLTLVTDPVLQGQDDQRGSRDLAGWEEQRLMSYSPLSASALSPGQHTRTSPNIEVPVDVSPDIPAAVPASRRFSLDEVSPEEVVPAADRFSLSDGVPEVIASERRFSLDSRFSVGSSVRNEGQSTANGASHEPSRGSSFTAITDMGMPVLRGGGLCSSEGGSPVVRGGSLCSSSSSMSAVDQVQLPVDEPVEQSLFDDFSGISTEE
ncbi:hypothetical protein TUN199_07436 [Pyrenophora tritici-repentis]|nr:hypothetical protein TUN199_07436 [Pyrenophora tritici-repentis]